MAKRKIRYKPCIEIVLDEYDKARYLLEDLNLRDVGGMMTRYERQAQKTYLKKRIEVLGDALKKAGQKGV